jgi:hypothetical protein
MGGERCGDMTFGVRLEGCSYMGARAGSGDGCVLVAREMLVSRWTAEVAMGGGVGSGTGKMVTSFVILDGRSCVYAPMDIVAM